jgi:hypothetical protein
MAASDCFDESWISPARRALSGHHDAQFDAASFELGGYKASDCQPLSDMSLELRVKQRSEVLRFSVITTDLVGEEALPTSNLLPANLWPIALTGLR